MSAIAVESRLARSLRFYDTTIGKKVVMAATGVILFGFVLSHMAGNLQVFLGREVMNQYAVALREMPAVLWAARAVLLIAVILHITATIQLASLKNAARPVGYTRKASVASSYASRTMYWSGPIIALFVIYHLLHLTWGTVHPQFRHLQPYENLVSAFRQVPIALVYILAVSLLGMHLYHGLWSMFQTLGLGHPRYTPMMKNFAVLFSAFVTAGFLAVPIAILAGIVS